MEKNRNGIVYENYFSALQNVVFYSLSNLRPSPLIGISPSQFIQIARDASVQRRDLDTVFVI